MTTETITIDRGFYETLVAAQKALLTRQGGEVAITYDELLAASNTTCTMSYDGDPDDQENGTWKFTIRDEPPPEQPERTETDTHDV